MAKEREARQGVDMKTLRALATRLLEDENYVEVLREISATTLGDAAYTKKGELNDPNVQEFAEEMLIGRLLASGAGRLSLGQMKAGAHDCCKWEAALAGSLVVQQVT